ncbi:MAG: hypothetical protein MPW14_05585 [Candidatus Manganitrophus sp.]|nr:MAG: hypothetical protein MPW14_05585 [Candidatus Manganitrophus sp.]
MDEKIAGFNINTGIFVGQSRHHLLVKGELSIFLEKRVPHKSDLYHTARSGKGQFRSPFPGGNRAERNGFKQADERLVPRDNERLHKIHNS